MMGMAKHDETEKEKVDRLTQELANNSEERSRIFDEIRGMGREILEIPDVTYRQMGIDVVLNLLKKVVK
jgi:hypothetical protein